MKNIFEPKNLNRQDNNKPLERFSQLFPNIKKLTSYLYINITDTILHFLSKFFTKKKTIQKNKGLGFRVPYGKYFQDVSINHIMYSTSLVHHI
jgi:hypothetical protein